MQHLIPFNLWLIFSIMPAALQHIQVELSGRGRLMHDSVQFNLRLQVESCKEFSIKGAKIQFTYKNIDPGLRARVTRSNLPVICLFIQFSWEWPGHVKGRSFIRWVQFWSAATGVSIFRELESNLWKWQSEHISKYWFRTLHLDYW